MQGVIKVGPPCTDFWISCAIACKVSPKITHLARVRHIYTKRCIAIVHLPRIKLFSSDIQKFADVFPAEAKATGELRDGRSNRVIDVKNQFRLLP